METNTNAKTVEVEVKELKTRIEKGTYSPTNVEIVKDLLSAKKVAAARIILDSEDETRKAYEEKAAAENAAKAVKYRKRFATARDADRDENGEPKKLERSDTANAIRYLVEGGEVPKLNAGSNFGRNYAIDAVYEIYRITDLAPEKIAALRKNVKAFLS